MFLEGTGQTLARWAFYVVVDLLSGCCLFVLFGALCVAVLWVKRRREWRWGKVNPWVLGALYLACLVPPAYVLYALSPGGPWD